MLMPLTGIAAETTRKPAAIQFEDAPAFIPQVTLGILSDSNVANAEFNEVSDTAISLRPSATFRAERHRTLYKLGYEGDYTRYSDTSENDFTHHKIRGTVDLDLSIRNQLSLGAELKKTSEDRGTHLSAGRGDQLTGRDKHDRLAFDATYRYGAPRAKGNIVVDLSHSQTEYTNRRETTAIYDHDTTKFSPAFLYRIAPKTQAVFRVRFTDNDYIENANSDSNETTVHIGALWETTGKTKSEFSIGSSRREYDRDTLDTANEISWRAGIHFFPRTYSKISIFSSQEIEDAFEDRATATDPNSIEEFFWVQNLNTVQWQHEWRSNLRSDVKFSFDRSKADNNNVDRKQRNDVLDTKITYDMRRWLQVGAGLMYKRFDSNRDNRDHDKLTTTIFVTGSL